MFVTKIGKKLHRCNQLAGGNVFEVLGRCSLWVITPGTKDTFASKRHQNFHILLIFTITHTVLLSFNQPKLRPSTSQCMDFQEIFRKCFNHVNPNKSSVVK